jgi:hypothetical protein
MLRSRALLQGSKEDEDNMTRKLEENTTECLRKHILPMKNIATGRAMLHIMLANGKSEKLSRKRLRDSLQNELKNMLVQNVSLQNAGRQMWC